MTWLVISSPWTQLKALEQGTKKSTEFYMQTLADLKIQLFPIYKDFWMQTSEDWQTQRIGSDTYQDQKDQSNL